MFAFKTIVAKVAAAPQIHAVRHASSRIAGFHKVSSICQLNAAVGLHISPPTTENNAAEKPLTQHHVFSDKTRSAL